MTETLRVCRVREHQIVSLPSGDWPAGTLLALPEQEARALADAGAVELVHRKAAR
jgi:hypothetical protein